MKTTQKHSKTPAIVISVFVFLLAAAGIAFGLALNDPNPPLVPSGQTDSIAVRLIHAAVTGEPARLSEEEVSALVSHKLARDGGKVQGVRFSINDNHTVNVYIPAAYKGLRLGFSAVVSPGWDSTAKQMTAAVQSVRIGRLPVPPRWFLSRVKKEAPQGLTVQGNQIRIPSSLLGGIPLTDNHVAYINGLSVSDHVFLVNVTADLNGLKNYLENFLKP
ncbi:hypothetical protein [Caproiciproducens galactitolivorans]|uniref:Uncharacterized protein n=1 Tax=Caproiciproducens galactitolivorans TaxID=642589 RepID=A0ABT4BS30_9FIRM|nr:hypothetical protein [Caproiciproducens galactitolivorans]MCY1712736.1 hypothetical protein [Caproiciproducens galactitolivorans]